MTEWSKYGEIYLIFVTGLSIFYYANQVGKLHETGETPEP
jgi:hypothetical protein